MSDLNETYRDIGKASAIIIALTLLDKLFAVIKEIIVANRFGISSDLDVFNIAYALPGIIGLILTGAILNAFIPLYLEWSKKISPQEANNYALSFLFIVTIFFGFLTALCFILSPFLFPLLGYGFGTEEKGLGIVMEKFLVFLIVIDGVGIILMGILQAQKRFLSLHVAPIFINITLIVLLLFFYGNLKIYTLVWGFLLGTLCKVLFMVIVLHRGGFRFFRRIVFDRSKLLQFTYLALPLLGSQLIANVNLLVDQVMATNLAAGSVSTLRYAFRLNDMPIQIIIMAVTVAILPFISEQAIDDDFKGLRHIFKQGIIFLGLLTFPITCMVTVFSEDVVAILFQRGAFDYHATVQTAQTLMFYSLGLFFLAYTFINGAFFSGLKDTKPLFSIGCLSIILNVLLNIIFMNLFGVKGIALSTTITLGIICSFFIFLLNRKIGIDFLRIAINLSRIIIASISMLVLGLILKSYLIRLGIDRLVYLPVGMIAASLCYLWVCWILRTEELIFFLNLFKKRGGI